MRTPAKDFTDVLDKVMDDLLFLAESVESTIEAIKKDDDVRVFFAQGDAPDEVHSLEQELAAFRGELKAIRSRFARIKDVLAP